MINPASRVPLFIAAIFVSIMLFEGSNTVSELNQKVSQQKVVTEGVHRWKQSYLALREVLQNWESNYRRDESIQDLVSLYAMIGLSGYGLHTNEDNVILNNVESITSNNLHIGLTKICLISTKGPDRSSLLVHADNYETLFAGLNKLAARPDIFIGNVTIKGGQDARTTVATATLGDFCVLLRTSAA